MVQFEEVDTIIISANGPAIWGGCVPAFFPKKRDAALFAGMVQLFLSITRVVVQTISKAVTYHGAGFKLRADERTLSGAKGGYKNHYKFVLSAGAKAKTMTSLFTLYYPC